MFTSKFVSSGIIALSVVSLNACGDYPVEESANVETLGESQAAIRGSDINKTYEEAMGRQPSSAEINYWNGQPNFSVPDAITFHASYIRNDAVERNGIIIKSYNRVFDRGARWFELDAWNQNVIDGRLIFINIVRSHWSYGRANRLPVTGQVCVPNYNAQQHAWESECGPKFYFPGDAP